MNEILEKKIKELCYKIKDIYSPSIMNYAKADESKKIEIMFFGVDTGVVRHIIDFLTQTDATEEEFLNFTESIINKAKEDTIKLLKPKYDEGNILDVNVNNSYNDIIKTIVEAREELLKTIKNEENETTINTSTEQPENDEEIEILSEESDAISEPDEQLENEALENETIYLGNDEYTVLKDNDTYELILGFELNNQETGEIKSKIKREYPELAKVKFIVTVAPENGIIDAAGKEVILTESDQRLQDAYDRAQNKDIINDESTEDEHPYLEEDFEKSIKDLKLDKEEAQILSEAIDEKRSDEIDIDLEDFSEQENQILNAKRFTPEQKAELIDELYKEFDEYVEENPEIGGRKIWKTVK